MDDVKIKVIDSDKLVNAINEGIQQANNRRKPEKIINQYGEWDYKQPLPEPYREGEG